ncbi:MAG: patatin-like phospholipase family protein [Bacteroidota bacterium]
MRMSCGRLLLFTWIWIAYLCSPAQSLVLKTDPSYYKPVQQRADGQAPGLGLGICISGGGHRASNLGAAILMALENYPYYDQKDTLFNLLNEMDYISGVSGGTWIGGAYMARRLTHTGSIPYSLLRNFDKELGNQLRKNYQSGLILHLFNPRLWFSVKNTGDILEKRIHQNLLLGRKNHHIRLSDFLIPTWSDEPVKHPYFIPAATNFENFAQVPIMPDVVEKYQLHRYTHLMKAHNLPLRDSTNHTYDGGHLPLSIGVKASSSFPVAIPVSTFERTFPDSFLVTKDRYLRLTDGGLTDQLGYKPALTFLEQDRIARYKYLLVVDAKNKEVSSAYSRYRGRPNLIRVLVRALYAGLESKYTTIFEDMERRANLSQTQIITFNIYSLTQSFQNFDLISYSRMNARIKSQLAEQLLTEYRGKSAEELLKAELDPTECLLLYHLYTKIGTKLKLTKDEQTIILLAGFQMVKAQSAQINRMITTSLLDSPIYIDEVITTKE